MDGNTTNLATTALKRCTKCGVEKPIEEFDRNRNSRNGRCPQCKACVKDSGVRRQYYSRPDVKKRRAEAYRRRKLGLTESQFAELLSVPNCEICGRRFGSGPRERHIDHCHETGIVRGVLCVNCNTSLGKVERLLDRVIEYLRSGGRNIAPQERQKAK